ncbi:MAG: mannose-1-phosphate guanylyltransferase/mannose-6-phosphate isomerase [Alphaproteobacteria bacterium]|nr:mannose-1-phosphate guanylyltransferase/mannose-6-phosphate isomerase [Alphaproteobacteria bacterium]
MTLIVPVIMCGGAGTRMWPLSRESMPKQFISLIGEHSSFQDTLLRLSDRSVFAEPVVITNQEYRFLVAEQMMAAGIKGEIVLEPVRRDSAAAVAAAATLAAARAPDAVVAMLAADHAVENRAELVRLCREAEAAAAQGLIVTLGIAPSYAATGYGYIRPGSAIAEGSAIRRVEAFVEKPDAATAAKYLKSGYLWNSGNFFFRADVMLEELDKLEPAIASAARMAVENAVRDLDFIVLDKPAFESAPKKSIDYAVMEHTRRAAVIPADIGWSDVGTWSAVRDLSAHDEQGNVVRGTGIVANARNVHIRSDDMLTAVVGVNDVIVVTTPDAVLVVHADAADKVKDLVEQLKREGRREPLEHRRVYRPWGYYQSVDNGARYQVKRISVKPGGKLSLQKHHHRAEHWIVVKGTAEVTRDGEVLLVHENESVYLPIGSVHRLANPGKIDLELIEVQTGSYLGEDDIVRIEDVYNRS